MVNKVDRGASRGGNRRALRLGSILVVLERTSHLNVFGAEGPIVHVVIDNAARARP